MEIDGIGPALMTALVMSVAGTVVGFAMVPLIGASLGAGPWIPYAMGFVISVLVLVIALNVVPGVRAGSVGTVIVAAVLLAALRTAASFAVHLADLFALTRT